MWIEIFMISREKSKKIKARPPRAAFGAAAASRYLRRRTFFAAAFLPALIR